MPVVILPVFLWDIIRMYLPIDAVEKLINADPMFNAVFPDMFYKAKFINQCNQSCIVVYESDIDPTATSTSSSTKKQFWMHALENKINCNNESVCDIMNRISYHNELRTGSIHAYYKVFSHYMTLCGANENYDFHHKKCSIEIIGIGCIHKISYYNSKLHCLHKIDFRGIESLVLNGMNCYSLMLTISNVNTLHINNCAFRYCILNIKLTRKITITACFFKSNSNIIINSYDPTNCKTTGCLNTVNIIKNQFHEQKSKHIIISVRHSSETPKINISENKFAKRQKLDQGISNCELTTVNNEAPIDIIKINQTKRLSVQDDLV